MFVVFAGLVASLCDVHREWRELKRRQKRSYLKAIKCVRSAPSQLTGSVSTSRWEDFVITHSTAGPDIHGTPAFLPWHRAFLGIFDKEIRKCGYDGPMPYWDWSFDSQAPESSPVWAFFGNVPSGCISMQFVGALTSQVPNPHCVQRNWYLASGNQLMKTQYSPAQIQLIMALKTFNQFRIGLESIPHNSVHVGIGGDMGSVPTSVNDPMFFLHHRNIDRLWAKWQIKYPDLALTYTGRANGVPVTVNDPLQFFGLQQDTIVNDVMFTRSRKMTSIKCYKYSNSITTTVRSERKIDSSFARTIDTSTPDSSDRTEEFKLRVPDPISDSFLKSMKYSARKIAQIRAAEGVFKRYTIWLNTQPVNPPANLAQLKAANKYGIVSKSEAREKEEDEFLESLVADFKESIEFDDDI